MKLKKKDKEKRLFAITKNIDLAILKSDVDKLNIDILKTTSNRLYNLKAHLEILDITKLKIILVDFKKRSHVAKDETVKD